MRRSNSRRRFASSSLGARTISKPRANGASASANFFAFSATKARATQTNAKLSPTRCRAIASKTAPGSGLAAARASQTRAKRSSPPIARVGRERLHAALAEAVPVGVRRDRDFG